MSHIAPSDPLHAMNGPKLFGHPRGLYILFFAEMWERFSYYGMRAILTLYMITSATDLNPGLGWDNGKALALYGWYTMLVYVMSIPGGILADKYIGQKKSVFLGGLILVAGHSILAIEQLWAFYTGLGLIILGVGGLKPNISTMVGGLYKQGDVARDQGFTIFYIGINVGAFLASLIVGFVGETIGWHYGFGLAGIGMALGQATFMWGQKFLKGVGEAPRDRDEGQKEDSSLGELFSNLLKSPVQLIITILLAAGSVFLAYSTAEGGDRLAYAMLGVFLSIVFGFMMMIYKDINEIEKDRFVVLLISFLIVIVFWGAFEQAGGLMNIYTLNKIDRVVSLFTIDSVFILFVAVLLVKAIMDKRKEKDTANLFFGLGGALLAIYLLLRVGLEVFSNPYEIPASVFQSVNALFIMIFGTIVGGFWIFWGAKGKETSSLFKMAVGTMIMGVGFIFMAQASNQIGEYGDKAALVLLILAYLFHTLGELCASPVALSFITKVAPVKYVSIMMGVYFAATGLGNKVAGTIGELSQTEPVQVSISANADLTGIVESDTLIQKAYDLEIVGTGSISNGEVIMQKDSKDLNQYFTLDEENNDILKDYLSSIEGLDEYTLVLRFEYDDVMRKQVLAGESATDLNVYRGKIEVFEVQDKQELWTFISIFVLTALFGLLLLIFLKKLKKLTHGAEDLDS